MLHYHRLYAAVLQMLEEWVWAPETLKQLSSHFAEAGKQVRRTMMMVVM